MFPRVGTVRVKWCTGVGADPVGPHQFKLIQMRGRRRGAGAGCYMVRTSLVEQRSNAL